MSEFNVPANTVRKPLRLAIVGMGGRSTSFMGYFAKNPSDGRVVALCDQIPEKARYLADYYGVKADIFENTREMIERTSPDALFITTSDHAHVQPAEAALAANIHVFCEKPMATTIEDCDRIINAAQKSSAIFYLGFNLRHGPIHETVHELISNGRIGKTTTIEANEWYYGGKTYFRRWNRLIRFGGESPIKDAVYVRLDADGDVWATSTNLPGQLPSEAADLRDRRLLRGDPASVNRLEFKRSDGPVNLLSRSAGEWIFQKPVIARADEAKVTQIIRRLFTLEIQRFVSETMSDPVTYGIGADEAALQATIWLDGSAGGVTQVRHGGGIVIVGPVAARVGLAAGVKDVLVVVEGHGAVVLGEAVLLAVGRQVVAILSRVPVLDGLLAQVAADVGAQIEHAPLLRPDGVVGAAPLKDVGRGAGLHVGQHLGLEVLGVRQVKDADVGVQVVELGQHLLRHGGKPVGAPILVDEFHHGVGGPGAGDGASDGAGLARRQQGGGCRAGGQA